ncbi:MAG TPA: zf-HC2 domain-containing protein [Methylomirabilota bacterium]|jgi:anti-sigma factor RsiW|nr:zf-HC2 domain-containing protein [Methylomirabilota bacterium]
MSATDHPETALVPYLRDQLAADERARVAAHLEACAACRGALTDTRAVLDALAEAAAAPEPHWGRYRAELRARLEARRRATVWWRRTVPVAVSATLAAALLLLTLRPTPVEQPPASLTPLEETALGARLDMLKHYEVVQRLDMLDEMDTVRNLDVVPVGGR